jgi:hypothetical protein
MQRRVIKIVFNTACFMLTCGLAFADTSDQFTQDEVRLNVHRYIDVVFGPVTPTLADYLGFEGGHNEAEYALELRECEKTYSSKSVSRPGDILANPECTRWISARRNNPSASPSLFYKAIREKLNVDPKNVTIVSILRKDGANGAYRVTVRLKGYPTIEFFHATRRRDADLGLVAISKVGSTPIATYLNVPSVSRSP